jgi:signal transduction histidine kinase
MEKTQAELSQATQSWLVSSALFAALQLILFWKLCTLFPEMIFLRLVIAALNLLTLTFFLLWTRSMSRDLFFNLNAANLIPQGQKSTNILLDLAAVRMDSLQRLERAEHEQMLLCEFSEEVLFVLSANGTILTANQSISRLWGEQPGSAIGTPANRFIFLDQQQQFAELLQKAAVSRAAETADFRVVSSLTEHCYARFTVEWSQTRQLFFCVATDVSDKSMVQNIKREYAAMLIHDLRAPLSSVKLALENIQDNKRDADREVNSALQSLSQLSSLVSKLILLDQSEAGELKIEKRMYPIFDIANESVQIMQPLATARHIKLMTDIPDCVVWCDRQCILQVFVNLLSNAIRYSADGTQIDLNADSDQSQLELKVGDRGPGVEDSHKSRIFERYKTIETGPTSTGLGLAVVKALIEAHAGEVGVRDRSGGGAEFFFTLKLASEQEIG